MSTGFRPLSTRALRALELHDLNPVDTSWSAFGTITCICQDGGAMGFLDFTKLLFALFSLAQPFNRVRNIQEHFFVILSQRKACAGRFQEETARKRTGPITRWLPRRLLSIRLEIVFIISPFTKRTKVAQKVFQEG